MTIEIVKAIKKSEDEAEKIISDSILKSRNIVSEAEKKKTYILENKIEDGEKQAKQIFAEMEISTQKEVDAIYKKAHEDGLDMRKQASDKLDRAVNIVMERIIKDHGNS